MDENLKISRRDALKTIGAACLTAAISIIPAPMEPEQEANRNARYRNPNVKLIDIIKANSQDKINVN